MQTSNGNAVSSGGYGTQIRKSPYFNSTLRWGAKGFSVYNHMYIPRDFGDPVRNFWNLVNRAILCDVAVERQVEIKGPDAARFTQYLCCRDLSAMEDGQCKYVFITDQDGGIINDPVLLRHSENRFWLSVADSDVLLWAKGVAVHAGMDVEISEPDVSPLQLQGPKSRDILRAAFGDAPASLLYFRFLAHDWDGVPLVISRTGWSGELGYEIYLCDGSQGGRLWEHLMSVGEPLGLKPGHTSTIRRIEAGMLSYHADMSLANNPFELGMDRLVDLGMKTDFVGKTALKRIERQGVAQKLVGLEISGDPLERPNSDYWPVSKDGRVIGYVTSAVHSPRLEKNIALAMLACDERGNGTAVEVLTDTQHRGGKVVPTPFYDPGKTLAIKG